MLTTLLSQSLYYTKLNYLSLWIYLEFYGHRTTRSSRGAHRSVSMVNSMKYSNFTSLIKSLKQFYLPSITRFWFNRKLIKIEFPRKLKLLTFWLLLTFRSPTEFSMSHRRHRRCRRRRHRRCRQVLMNPFISRLHNKPPFLKNSSYDLDLCSLEGVFCSWRLSGSLDPILWNYYRVKFYSTLELTNHSGLNRSRTGLVSRRVKHCSKILLSDRVLGLVPFNWMDL